MDYVVLARKLRPTRFSELIGQETVVRALRNAIATNRVAHAFLFAGSRGVGKTSTARILTKALNCLQPEEGEPCNACANCQEIASNAAPDVFEIDAASNRGIDNIRELRENTKFAPVKCRYKTYIIDEVHMLTQESFNALLKTLEEPPAHVKFILATTNPHRIPETILSRCQRFDFSRIPVKTMADYMAEATRREGIELSRSALETIARNASGGMRDALTAVDQVVAYGGASASDEQVLSILGLMDNREVYALLGAVLERSLPGALEAFATIHRRGHDLGVLLQALIRELKDFTLYLTLGGQDTTFADHLPDSLAFYEAHKGRVTLDTLQQLFYLFLEVEGQLKRSEFAQACMEMGLVKACRVEPLVGVPDLLSQVRAMMQGGRTPEPGAPARAVQPPAATARPAGSAVPPAMPAPRRGRERGAGSHPAGGHGDRAGGDEGEEAEPAGHPGPVANNPPASEDAPYLGGFPDEPPPEYLQGAAASEAAGPTPEELLAVESPCDDPRWRAFAERVNAVNRKLGAHLRRVEVADITADTVTLVLPDAAAAFAPQEWTQLEPLLREAFSDAFRIHIDDDRTGKARPEHTIAGRNRLRQAAHVAARRAEAAGDETVQRLRRFFPASDIVEIRLNETRHSNGSDDVQG